MGNDLFNQWKAAFEAKDWEREKALWQAMGHMPVTEEIRALARALHSIPVKTAAIRLRQVAV